MLVNQQVKIHEYTTRLEKTKVSNISNSDVNEYEEYFQLWH
jgi:hypothetical protein